jgi:hypothetical protein
MCIFPDAYKLVWGIRWVGLFKTRISHELKDPVEKIKASIRAKSTSQLLVMLTLSNLWMVRKRKIQVLQT